MDNKKIESFLLLQIASDINNFEDLVDFYAMHQDYLKDYTIINATDRKNSINIYSAFSNEQDIKQHLSTPFVNGKINIVNSRILRKLNWHNRIDTGIEMCVSFDTQTVSYFNRYYREQLSHMPEHLDIAMSLLHKNNVGVDYIPYSMENLMFSSENIESVFDSIYTFERLYYKEKRTKEQCCAQADQVIQWYTKMRSEDYFEARDLFCRVYACLLKLCYIQLVFSKYSINKKMNLLCDFMNKELCTMLYPELILAKQYFQHGQQYYFFGKIQKARKDLVENIKNMAWDLFHLRMLEMECAYKSSQKANAFIPCFFTYDKRLLQVKECYELKSMVVNEKTFQRFPFYSKINEVIEFIQEFSTKERLLERSNKRETVNIAELIKELEHQILML